MAGHPCRIRVASPRRWRPLDKRLATLEDGAYELTVTPAQSGLIPWSMAFEKID